jgi:serine/threonine-protein kinase
MAEAAARARLPQLAKYEILEEIGHGGMATVYRAQDKRLGRDVAVKLIHPHLRDSHEVVARFNTEAKAVAKLHHPNIVEVFDVSDPDEGDQYLVVELIRGTTLRKLLQARGSGMPPEIAAAIGLDLLGAVAHAHASGVVHRDIKPENVLIEHRPPAVPRFRPGSGEAGDLPSGSERSLSGSSQPPGPGDERVIVKLTDFGIAKLLDAQGVTSTGQVLGSPAHMAPEQIEGAEVDGRADIFGMGVMLYECMVGHLPFEGNNPAQVLRRVLDGQYPEAQREKPTVGSRWSALLDRALAHAPSDRFPDAGAMRAAIAEELARLGVAAPKQELEAWFDDADAYEERHRARMVETLCALGDEARRRGEVIQAASDWNRALAHAPDDPKLLRLVAGMHRARARARTLRRVGSVLALSVCLGTAAFVAGRLLKSRTQPAAIPSASGVAVVAEPPHPAPVPAPEASSGTGGGPGTARARLLPAAVRVVASSSASKGTDRTVTLELTPAHGVRVSVDSAPERPVQMGDTLTLSDKSHSLAFSCPVCKRIHREVAEGDQDETLRVVVPILPAVLVVDGPSDKSYQVAENPLIDIHAGDNSVSMDGQFQSVTVVQLGSGTRVAVRLEAGKAVHAAF